MADLNSFYINSESLCLSKSIWTDSNLTTIAPDGVYAYENEVVQLTAGVVTPLNQNGECPTCITPCNNSNLGDAYTWSPVLSPTVVPAQAGTFEIPYNLGNQTNDTGAVILRVFLKGDPANPLTGVSAPMGMRAWINNPGGITEFTNLFSGSGTDIMSGAATNGQTVINTPTASVGATKNINDTALTTVLNVPVYVGRSNDGAVPASDAYFSSINVGAPAACGGGLTLPNNTPFSGGTAAPTVTYTGLPKYSWNWDTNAFVNTATPTNIVVEQQQVQVGGTGGVLDAAGAPSGNGFRGWLTAVLPRTTISENNVVLELTNTMCQGGAVAVVSCPQVLTPIECTSPQDTLEQACAMTSFNTTVYNVPGANGMTGLNPQYIFPSGKPNLGDIICGGSLGQPLTLSQKNKYYKYIDADGPMVFYVDEYGVVAETKLSCLAGDGADFDTAIVLEEQGIGGGIYRTTWTVPATSTGAVILRVLTGNNPKGLIATHFDIDGNMLGKTNMFSVRGAGADNGLEQSSYTSRIDLPSPTSTNDYVASGAIWGGCALTMGSKNAPASSNYIPHYMEEYDWPLPTGPANPWWGMLQTTMALDDQIYGCQEYGGDNNSVNNSANNYPYSCFEACYYPGTIQYAYAVADAPVYIGLVNFGGSFIPCTSQTLLTVTGNPVGCGTNCFNPESGGSMNDSNLMGIINLPPNGNHGGTNLEGVGPELIQETANPYLPEVVFLKTNLCIVYPQAGNGWNQEGTDWTNVATRFPENTTGCTNGGLYNLWTLGGAGTSYINTGDARRLYITPPQVQLYSPNSTLNTFATPGWSMAVIPLTGVLAADEIIDLDIYVPSSNASFIVYADSPAALPASAYAIYGPHPINETSGAISTMCAANTPSGVNLTPYIAMNAFGGEMGPCIPGNANVAATPCSSQSTITIMPRINDILFQDSNGETKVPPGRYYYTTGAGVQANNFVIEVDQFGVVTCLSGCASGFGAAYTQGGCALIT